MAPPLLNEFIKQNLNSFPRATRRCDYKILCRESTFGQSAFSYTYTWNTTPTEVTNSVKLRSLENQICHCLCFCSMFIFFAAFVFIKCLCFVFTLMSI